MMKMWLLSPVENLPRQDNPWEPWYDKAFGFVVRAETEAEARALAEADCGDESRDGHRPWADAKYSTCSELLPEGEAGVVMRDFSAA